MSTGFFDPYPLGVERPQKTLGWPAPFHTLQKLGQGFPLAFDP